MNATFRPLRLFVTGGSRLSPKAALLWRELGNLLAAEDGLVLITGGLDGLKDSPDARTADRAIVDGFLEGSRQRGIAGQKRVETFLPDPKLDWSELKRFEVGRVHLLTNRTAQSRRFRMVHSADVIVSIEGRTGTRSVLDVALAIERPILPLPFGKGVSATVWQEERAGICEWFQIPREDADEFDRISIESMDEAEIRSLAERVRSCLMRGFTRTCFVIMPFGKEHDSVYEVAICPALAAQGLQPVRTDRHVPTGNVIAAIRDGLRHCLVAIADTTGDRPNVMYELGMAHADDKPVVLLRKLGLDGKFSPPPFDLQTESIISYSDDLDDLRRHLETAIAVVRGKMRGVNEVDELPS
jgi:hypothetical protein